jgi:hypothetical protein
MAACIISILSFALSWSMSMARRGVGVPEESMLASLKSIVTEGFQLPWLNTLSKMEIPYIPFIERPKLIALFLILLCALTVYGIWRFRTPHEKVAEEVTSSSSLRPLSS